MPRGKKKTLPIRKQYPDSFASKNIQFRLLKHKTLLNALQKDAEIGQNSSSLWFPTTIVQSEILAQAVRKNKSVHLDNKTDSTYACWSEVLDKQSQELLLSGQKRLNLCLHRWDSLALKSAGPI